MLKTENSLNYCLYPAALYTRANKGTVRIHFDNVKSKAQAVILQADSEAA